VTTIATPSAAAMRFVSQRPRFTAGIPVAGFPAIRSVLYSDAECEVYLLDTTGSRSLLLIGRRQTEGMPGPEVFHGFLARHGGATLATPRLSPDVHDTVVAVHGRWMGEIPAQPLLEGELYALLMVLIDLAIDAAEVGLAAVPVRPLLWLDGPSDDWRLTPVHVRTASGRPDDEADIVREIGQTFLYAATGIASVDTEQAPDEERLGLWCQNADAGLAQIISRCLGAARPITGLRELRLETAACVRRRASAETPAEQSASQYIGLSPRRLLWLRRTS
jgi:hypothetical protein